MQGVAGREKYYPVNELICEPIGRCGYSAIIINSEKGLMGNIRLICTDVDGTLVLDDHKSIPEANMGAGAQSVCWPVRQDFQPEVV